MHDSTAKYVEETENWEEEEERRDDESFICSPIMKQLCSKNVITRCTTGSGGLEDSRVFYTDVVIIGNGPSGLALSAFLGGWRPLYDLRNPHPHRDLHQKFAENADISLIDQDFSWLANHIGSEEGSISRAFPILYDSLTRPDIDLGHDHESSIRWEKRDDHVVPHVVLGSGISGGAWNTFDEEVHTLSLNRWMDLPGLSLAEFLVQQKMDKNNNRGDISWDYDTDSRLPCGIVAKYFRNYPRAAGIQSHQLPYSFVTSVFQEEGGDDHSWHVIGYHSTSGPFHFRAKKLCLATGVSVPRTLEVPGEFEDTEHILHSSEQLEHKLHTLAEQDFEHPVLVIGGGLTAADSLIQCLLRRLVVAHAFRKGQRETRKTVMGRLSKSIYPEYHAVTSLMSGKASDTTYIPYAASKILRFEFDQGRRFAVLEQSIKGVRVEKSVEFSFAVINIGYRADLSFLSEEISGILPKNPELPPDNKLNTLDIDPVQYRSNKMDHLYAVGPLAGDNYVRYLTGGCFAAAKDIISRWAAE